MAPRRVSRLTDPVQIDRVDPRAVDDTTWQTVADLTNAELAADAPAEVAVTAETMKAEATFTFDDRPYDGFWLARHDERVAGWASLELSAWDNPDQGFVSCGVAPADRRRGVGTRLLEQQVAAVTGAGRSKLMTFAFRNCPTVDLLLGNGFMIGQLTVQRRLLPQEIDYAAIKQLADEAAAHAQDYELLQIVGATPEEWLPRLATLAEAINDAPVDDLDVEPDAFPEERIRRGDRALARRGQVVYRLVARHRDTDEWAGHTVLCVDRLRPGIAHQEDTTVVAAHRGHRLGLWLKSSMLLWMLDVEPSLTQIDTWNAESNSHMIEVNERLGCRVSNLACALQRQL